MAKIKNLINGEKAELLIHALGGVNETARICKIAASSVSSWRKLGVPRARLMYLKLKYPELSVWNTLNVEA